MNKSFEHNVIIEFNVDGIVSQHISYFMNRLFNYGVSDVYVTPIIMKKGRPGFLFTISCSEKIEKQIIEIVFFETTTSWCEKKNF